MDNQTIYSTLSKKLLAELEGELRGDILTYWMNKMSDEKNVFVGRRDGFDHIDFDAPKGVILCGRILWTYSCAYRLFGVESYLEEAHKIYEYLRDRFVDHEYGGVYWALNPEGEPYDTKKQFYAIAFCIYGIAEYVRVTGDRLALKLAMDLFHSIEDHSRDREKGGYIEAMTQDWQPIDDLRLSDKDDNAEKTMNTHLHILEGYTNLLRVAPEESREEVAEAVRHCVEIFLDRIIRPDGLHFGLFFDMDWKCGPQAISYGHDIEGSWLILESADVLGDAELSERVMKAVRLLADGSLEGRSDEGWMAYELHADGRLDEERHWWVQAEMVVGLVYLFVRHDVPMALRKAVDSWEWIKKHLLDHRNGEWFWSELPDGSVNHRDDKAGFWKCPYHNSRMCMEVISVLKEWGEKK